MNKEQDIISNQIRYELKYQMLQIEESINALCEALSNCQLVSANVFVLPPVQEGTEHHTVSEISVEKLSDKEAFFAALKAFRKVHAENGVSKKAAFRLPGYIQVIGDRSHIASLVAKVNEHKEAFKNEVQKIEGAKRKSDLVHKLFPQLLTKQLYRKLHCMPEQISALGFCWAQRHVIYKKTKAEIIDQIEKQKSQPPKNAELDDWIAFLNREIHDVQRLSDKVELRIKRPAKVNPVVNSDSEDAPQLSAHLPIIVVQEQLLTVTPLQGFDSKFRRCVRSDSTIGGKPLIKRLHLYVKGDPKLQSI